jgi:small subunit ribosomal protein S9
MVKKNQSFKYYEAVGRRKEAVARCRLYLVNKTKVALVKEEKIQAGEIRVNNLPIEQYFPRLSDKTKYLLPLKLTASEERFAISIKVKGGGKAGQLGAVILAVARALEKVDKEKNRPVLKKLGLLHRDPRVKERRKVGTGGKARREKQSPKR